MCGGCLRNGHQYLDILSICIGASAKTSCPMTVVSSCTFPIQGKFEAREIFVLNRCLLKTRQGPARVAKSAESVLSVVDDMHETTGVAVSSMANAEQLY